MGKKIKKEVEPPPKDVFDPLTIESKKAATVVLMLNSPEEEILAKACEAIYKFALKGEENKATLLELGAVEPLTKLLTHEDKVVRRNATMIFGILASNSDVKKLLRELEVMNSVIAQLAPEEEVVIHEFASLCLANMSVEYTGKVQIFEHGGLEPLIRLLSSPDPDVKKNSIECIYNLVQDFQCRTTLQELNAIPPILELLKSEYPIIQLLALKTLGVITCDKESRTMLKDNQGLDQLTKILEAKELNDLHVEALSVIANCLEDMDTMVLMQQTGGLKKLLSFAENSTIPDIQKNAAKAITKAAYDPENRKIFHEQEVEKCLVTLLGSDSEGTKIAASQAISAMSENSSSKDFFNTQGIPQIVQLLRSDNEEVREAAALALANLTTSSPANANAAAEADAIDPLINILSSKRDGAIANAATVLTNMAIQEPLRSVIQSHEVMHALLGPLHSTNTVVQSTAALTVAATACDVEARNELRNCGGLEPLTELLHSKNDEVRRHASWAVMVCASDELTAVELCRLGALDILEEINLSVSRKNKFSEAAYNKLLNNNLSLKYSQTGYLSSSNIITDGFYDFGRINPGTKLLPLKELCLQELNDHRAILLVNSKSETSPPPSMEDKLSDVGYGRSISSSSSLRRASKEKSTFHFSAGFGSPTEEKSEPTSGRNTVLSRGATKEKGSRKGRGKKEEEKVKEEEEVLAVPKLTEGSPDKEWYPPPDPEFCVYVYEVTKSILPIINIKDQIEALAKYVADKMGGKISKEKLSDFSWELHISELKFQLKSNVIPIGYIKKGIFYHRALLFKALADKIGVGCCLVRGEYSRAWNEVKLLNEARKGIIGRLPPPEEYIVDLMFHPGALLKLRSKEADLYRFL
ncbi:armadillo repeat-containing protein 3 isoform X1 [Alexandromys fortis]|uniref:armadillo repeat-containing protein 3 isoform X1 n=1 Tax=Alexandromys fortis TaxID=100897 RepID=UPI00215319B8|nr:armadillo repeat-containing protein 3 isoform X1 [Microtus fortis]XP_050008690.1 armadillo repeat-containing protein 3 isoform X1 [Microtus fortis]XP_050008691.1 armadillo repeat-containing protein 3 isoform X1 [Microtus fortis]XP_050008692.1 armadillo repeat-containing protein 3 isoform X1 [Microtus fortis]XP_050008693.1 armadillo repeat-containing protein 3 isoform X1 [Microtus fortis]XP_050008694.1 armadillo repeat-containing protein 3 isoform X1 [Microtus fortis]